MRKELENKRLSEDYQKQLVQALAKNAPSSDYPLYDPVARLRKPPSREASRGIERAKEMNSFEQMLFGGTVGIGRPASNPAPQKPVAPAAGGYINIDPKGSLNAESTLLPIDHNSSLTNHFGGGLGTEGVLRNIK